MNKEIIRMQMLAGIVTEGQYKQLLENIEGVDRISDGISAQGKDSLAPGGKEHLKRYHIYEEIKGIFNGDALDLREYGLCFDDDEDCEATLSVGPENEKGQWITIPLYIGVGNMLNREEIDIILKKELNPEDYKKINIEYSKPNDDEILIQLKRMNKIRLGSIRYYAG